MALTKGQSAIIQLAGSGTSTTLDCSASFGTVLLLKHSNGTGTVETAASIGVEVKTQGGTAWYRLTTPIASYTAGSVDDIPVAIPDGAASVRLVYSAPIGPTGPSLDAEIGTVAT